MRKLRLLHLNAGTNLGGTETMLIRFLDNVDKNRFQVSVGAFLNTGPLLSQVKERNLESVMFNIKHRWNPFEVLSALVKLYRFLKSKQIDIIHLYGFYTNILGRIIARMAKTPIVITGLRMETFVSNGFQSFLERMTANWSDLYISVSERGQELMLKNRWVPKEKVLVVHNGIETDWANGRKPDTTQPRIGMIADFNKYKAQQDLVVAAAEVLKKFPDARFVLAGEGETKKNIIEMIAKRSLTQNFIVNGFAPDVRKILSELSIFVLATRTEGLPVSIIEAMLFGLPVVASRVGGIPELVEDGVTGILVKPESPKELALAINELVANPAKASRMGEMGKIRVKQHFTIEPMMEKLESLYLDLAKRKGLVE